LLNPSERRVTDLTAPPSQALSGRRELATAPSGWSLEGLRRQAQGPNYN